MNAQVDRLIVEWDANFSKLDEKLNKVIRSNYGAARKVEQSWEKANDNIAKTFGRNAVGQGLDAFANRAPAAVAGLQGVSAAGTAAAVAVGAVVAAFAGARAAAAFADDLADTADRLHVTTDALQEYRYAIRAAGGEEAGADEALESFSVTLGNAQRGMVKAQKAFLQLGFTKAQVSTMTDADAALGEVAKRISELPLTQQDALIKALGLEGLKPLIQAGGDEMVRLREEAHRVGVVMDADLVKRGAELNDQFETVAKVIDVQLKSALVDLGPVLVDLLGLMADMVRGAADLVDAFRSIDERSARGLRNNQAMLSGEVTRLGLKDLSGQRLSGSERAVLGQRREQLAQVTEQLEARNVSNAAKPVTPTRALVDTSSSSSGAGKAAKEALQRERRSADLVADAVREEADAAAQMTDSVEERLQFELDAIEAARAAKAERIKQQLADKDITQAAADKALALGQQAADLRADLARRAADERGDDLFFARQREIGGYYDEIATIQADMADTVRERYEIERRLLLAQQKREREETGRQLARQVEHGEISQESADAQIGALGDLQAAQQGQLRDTTRDELKAGILDAFEAAKQGVGGLADYFGDRLKAKILDGLAEAVANTVLSAGKGGGGGGGWMAAAASAIGSILGFANGTVSSPSGLAVVGERGRELVKLPGGSQVIPNHALSGLRVQGAAPVVHQKVILQNPVIFEDEMARVMAYADATAARAGQQSYARSVSTANRAAPGRMRQFNELGT